MATVPSDTAGKISFYENHTTPWSTNATAIGTTTTAVTDLTTKTTAARAAFNAQFSAQEAAKAATLALHAAVTAMATAGSDIIQSIKTKAATAGDGVYVLAQIPAPATPTPVGPPGTPESFKVELNPDGSLKLTWKCANPAGSSGTTYQVFRKASGESSFTFIGASGTRSFNDTTVPAGSAPITYQIVALRSTASGTAAQFIVNFGVGGSGEMMASVTAAPRMAA